MKDNPLLAIQPNQVTRGLQGYSVFLYGRPKSGKTTIASQFPKTILFACEKGYKALPGVIARPIPDWRELKKSVDFLDDEDVKEAFTTVVLDTANTAWDFCTKWVGKEMSDEKNTYKDAADTPYQKGMKLAKKEFDDLIRRILYLGYGLVIISHGVEKTLKNDYGEEYQKWEPNLDKGCYEVTSAACDIIGYARSVTDIETGAFKSRLYLRDTDRYFAGSRFQHMPNSIPFTYEALNRCVEDAVDSIADLNPSMVTETQSTCFKGDELAALLEEFQEVAKQLMTKDRVKYKEEITSTVATHLGEGNKITDCGLEDVTKIKAILTALKALS